MPTLSIHMQREFSIAEGKPREKPNNPIRRQRGVVQIGNRRMLVEVEKIQGQPSPEQVRRQFVQAFAKRQNHECAATQVGEWCGHLI